MEPTVGPKPTEEIAARSGAPKSISVRSKCFLSQMKQPQGEAVVQRLRVRLPPAIAVNAAPPATGANWTTSALSDPCNSSPYGCHSICRGRTWLWGGASPVSVIVAENLIARCHLSVHK